ncbi:hypothetical protein WICPIJ_008547 [Wickerhamomyces pijperi]|uniref:Post-GPI attachment to proteins factor 3 n=1 Tax=Wickerhamomyces pijperi TaxID=599730 RepID=A0A9P8PWJ6_WICPI|nr:hypothetical protein WICPIJ_008547 [Wickerhamomyces pijperi]
MLLNQLNILTTVSVLSLSLFSQLASASEGDQLEIFERCVDVCTNSVCVKQSEDELFSRPSVLLQALFWTCEDNCDYQCQQIITELREDSGEEVVQFHGKWPFRRILFTQEFFSTLFSMLNFIPHFINFQKLNKLYRSTHNSKKVLYFNVLLMSVVAMGAWTFSSIFHIRDLIITERLDYFFAGATVLSGFHAMVIRVFRFDLDEKKRKLTSYICLAMYAYHFIRLNIDWSYTYNMQANIAVAIAQYVLFIMLAYKHYKANPKQRELYILPLALIASVVFGMSFEVFDFVQLDWQVDAHAVWHLSTIVPSFWLYDFFYLDIDSLSKSRD